MNIPLLHLIQTNTVWSANAGFLLTPLPLNELLVHQYVNQVLSPVQDTTEV